MKKLLIKIRSSIKLLILLCIATFLIVGAVAFLYKPIYSVTLNGELIGYCGTKRELQTKIDDYIENGSGENTNIAFVQIDDMPEYKLCLLKRGIVTNDEEIYNKVTKTGVTYYRYYAILEDEEEKSYVSDFQTAEQVVSGLKDKDSNNIDNITIIEKYDTEMKSFNTAEEVVSNLYVEKVKAPVVVANTKRRSTGSVSTSTNISKSYVSVGINFIKPVTGSISSRFGSISSVRSSAHTGLDIATSYGTPISAAASGTVSFSGYKGSYGYLVVITHSNGVQTYYGHCSKLYVSAGESISQGQKIGAVGSTGNSTGSHLHFEVRVNGVAYNPQNYIY